MRREQGLIWHGRWGTCDASTASVRVFAPVTVVLEAGLQDALEEDKRWWQILEAVGSSLCSELSGSGVLVAVHWKPNWQAARHRRLMHALILGEVAACHSIWQTHWQQVRRLLDDKAFVFWKDIVDTADPDRSRGHCRQLYDALNLRQLESPGLALELPAQWVEGMVESQSNSSSALRRNCEWELFFQLFGPLSLIERIINESGRAVLLACFEEPQAALAMYECLVGRCLYFPSTSRITSSTDCFPALCTVRDYDALKAQLYRNERVQDDEPAFVLRRIASAVKPRPPEVILVTTTQPTLVCGREGSVDIPLRAPHVSKVHAVLQLSRDGASWKLTIEDRSSNGTWVNGVRLKAKEQMALNTRDQICFVPPGNGVEQLVYEVLPANMLQRTACRPTEVLDPEPLRGSYARSRSRGQDENISTWLQSVGDPELLSYQTKLMRIVATPSDIRNKYGDNISGFLADLNVSDQHKSSFRRALLKLRRES